MRQKLTNHVLSVYSVEDSVDLYSGKNHHQVDLLYHNSV